MLVDVFVSGILGKYTPILTKLQYFFSHELKVQVSRSVFDLFQGQRVCISVTAACMYNMHLKHMCLWVLFLVTAVTDLHFCQALLNGPEVVRERCRHSLTVFLIRGLQRLHYVFNVVDVGKWKASLLFFVINEAMTHSAATRLFPSILNILDVYRTWILQKYGKAFSFSNENILNNSNIFNFPSLTHWHKMPLPSVSSPSSVYLGRRLQISLKIGHGLASRLIYWLTQVMLVVPPVKIWSLSGGKNVYFLQLI